MNLRRITFWNLIAQSAIIVTGVSVRVTGSGLGCPTWPQCVPGSYVPTVEQAQSWHKFVEFGNRTLTFALTAIALLTLIAVLRSGVADRRTRYLAAVPLGGTAAQAVLGGITVLTGLNPYTVMAHFLLSILLVAAAHSLWVRVADATGHRLRDRLLLDIGSRAMVVVAALVILLGTVVTGSGPHSGDAEKPARFGLDPQLMSWVHADVVWLSGGLALALWAYTRWSLRSPEFESRSRRIVELIVAQGVVGYLQYWTDLPWYLVIVHAALAAWFWISVLQLRSDVRRSVSA